ncbi:hypothetical protein [Acetobacterium sp.]|uniref:hypothetical protein n=1 Tax=Acetobacterium sp. TaxID=1872094 RepID=UPI00359319D9
MMSQFPLKFPALRCSRSLTTPVKARRSGKPAPPPAAGNPNQQHTRPPIIAMAGRVLFFKKLKKAGTCTIFGRVIVV